MNARAKIGVLCDASKARYRCRIMLTRHTTPPTLAELELIAIEELERIPAELRQQVEHVVIRVEEFPDEETEREMGLESPFDLLGLYRGVALPNKSLFQVNVAPDMIFLYRRPLLDYWSEHGEDLCALIRHVLIHEIGHHFGFSDADMERIERE
jgi:predicted Zn-dependent protease with MMP-like domain